MRRLYGVVALLGLAVVLTLAAGWSDGAAAQTTTTTAPPPSTQPMLPTTTNGSSMPQTGSNTAELVGLAVSCLLIGYGICSISRGVSFSE